MTWIESEKELPSKDGMYEVSNHIDEGYTADYPGKGICEYDGWGFKFQNTYRSPKYWREIPKRVKRYGKQS